MMNKNEMTIEHIPQEKFQFVNEGANLHDKKFEDKPVGYFRDAFNRFCRNKGSVVAAIIIIGLILFAFLAPLLITTHTGTFLDVFYAKKPPRMLATRELGFLDGGSDREFVERGLIKAVAIGMAAEDGEGLGNVTLEQGLDSYYQPLLDIGEPRTVAADIIGAKPKTMYSGRIDNYLEVGFVYRSVEQAEYQRIRAWEEETGLQVLYPLIENNEYCSDPNDANAWYKTKKNDPVTVDPATGKTKVIPYAPGMVLEDNYKRDAEGNVRYYEYTGGGNHETAQYKVRVLYYNYFRYLNGYEPEFLMGADSQGHDLTLRLAGGIRLSILLAICVSAINLTLGALYGAIEGYYGGVVDMTMERVSDILSGIPFTIVVVLFQLHLSAKVGAVPSLLLAFVVTGWIGTASTVRHQFYRFKGQEYILAARTLGAKDRRIIWKHIFPNALGTIITSSVLVIPGVISSESTMSYLGIVKLSSVETTSLGVLLADAAGFWTLYPHLLLFPAIVLALLMISFNLFGNGLRDAFNPSLRGVEE